MNNLQVDLVQPPNNPTAHLFLVTVPANQEADAHAVVGGAMARTSADERSSEPMALAASVRLNKVIDVSGDDSVAKSAVDRAIQALERKDTGYVGVRDATFKAFVVLLDSQRSDAIRIGTLASIATLVSHRPVAVQALSENVLQVVINLALDSSSTDAVRCASLAALCNAVVNASECVQQETIAHLLKIVTAPDTSEQCILWTLRLLTNVAADGIDGTAKIGAAAGGAMQWLLTQFQVSTFADADKVKLTAVLAALASIASTQSHVLDATQLLPKLLAIVREAADYCEQTDVNDDALDACTACVQCMANLSHGDNRDCLLELGGGAETADFAFLLKLLGHKSVQTELAAAQLASNLLSGTDDAINDRLRHSFMEAGARRSLHALASVSDERVVREAAVLAERLHVRENDDDLEEDDVGEDEENDEALMALVAAEAAMEAVGVPSGDGGAQDGGEEARVAAAAAATGATPVETADSLTSTTATTDTTNATSATASDETAASALVRTRSASAIAHPWRRRKSAFALVNDESKGAPIILKVLYRQDWKKVKVRSGMTVREAIDVLRHKFSIDRQWSEAVRRASANGEDTSQWKPPQYVLVKRVGGADGGALERATSASGGAVSTREVADQKLVSPRELEMKENNFMTSYGIEPSDTFELKEAVSGMHRELRDLVVAMMTAVAEGGYPTRTPTDTIIWHMRQIKKRAKQGFAYREALRHHTPVLRQLLNIYEQRTPDRGRVEGALVLSPRLNVSASRDVHASAAVGDADVQASSTSISAENGSATEVVASGDATKAAVADNDGQAVEWVEYVNVPRERSDSEASDDEDTLALHDQLRLAKRALKVYRKMLGAHRESRLHAVRYDGSIAVLLGAASSDHPALRFLALDILREILINQPENQEAARLAGACEVVVHDGVEFAPTPRVQKAALSTLSAYCQHSVENQLEVAHRSAAVLMRVSRSPVTGVRANAWRCTQVLVNRSNRLARERLVDAGLVTSLMDALRIGVLQDDTDLLQSALAALCTAVEDDFPVREALRQAGLFAQLSLILQGEASARVVLEVFHVLEAMCTGSAKDQAALLNADLYRLMARALLWPSGVENAPHWLVKPRVAAPTISGLASMCYSDEEDDEEMDDIQTLVVERYDYMGLAPTPRGPRRRAAVDELSVPSAVADAVRVSLEGNRANQSGWINVQGAVAAILKMVKSEAVIDQVSALRLLTAMASDNAKVKASLREAKVTELLMELPLLSPIERVHDAAVDALRVLGVKMTPADFQRIAEEARKKNAVDFTLGAVKAPSPLRETASATPVSTEASTSAPAKGVPTSSDGIGGVDAPASAGASETTATSANASANANAAKTREEKRKSAEKLKALSVQVGEVDVRDGMLWRQEGKLRPWVQRRFVLTESEVILFGANNQEEFVVPLETMDLCAADKRRNRVCMRLTGVPRGHRAMKGKRKEQRVFYAAAATERETKEWMIAINEAIIRSSKLSRLAKFHLSPRS